MSNEWRMLALLGSALLAGCYGSSGQQAKDGQSHWLEICSSASDCSDGEICACGVCTIACEQSAACGAGSSCEGVAARAACADAPSNVARVCLTTCDGEDLCGGSGVSCASGACVATTLAEPVTDAGIDSGTGPLDDAGDVIVDEPDASAPKTTVDTIEGPLTCSDLMGVTETTVAVLKSAHSSCETERDCVCAFTSTTCMSSCSESVSVSTVAAFQQSLADFERDYCSDPSLSTVCDPIFTECLPCQPVCNAGICASTSRSGCSISGLACPDEKLCHIDNTCIDRGAEDSNGVATLAIASELDDRGPAFPGIPAFVVTDDAVIWIDAGTFDSEGTHNEDATVYSLGFGETVAVVLTDHHAVGVANMAFDETNVYFTTAEGIWSVPRNGGAPAFHLVERLELEQSPWVLHEGFIYYVNTPLEGYVRRVRTDASEDSLVWSNADIVRALAVGGDRLYVEQYFPEQIPSYVNAIDISTTAFEIESISGQFRNSVEDVGPLLISDSLVLADLGMREGFQLYDADSQRLATLAGDAWLDLRSVDGDFVYYVEGADAGVSDTVDWFIGRNRPSSDTSERLRQATGPVGQVTAVGDTLYWVEDRRLLRKAL